MNERSIDLLEAELLEEKNKLDAESRDHTGAVREHLLHKHLDKIIAENVEFTQDGAKLKHPDKKISLIAISAIDLQMANSELGKHAGDEYLQKTAEQNATMFYGETIYHRGAQNFSVISENEKTLEIWQIQEDPIKMGSLELRNSISEVKLERAVELYNEFMKDFSIDAEVTVNPSFPKKVFTELFFRLSEYEREYKIAFDLGEKFLRETQISEQDAKQYEKFTAYIFHDTRFASSEGFKANTPEEKKERLKSFTMACKKVAENSVFGAESEGNSYWKTALTEFANNLAYEHSGKMPPTKEKSSTPKEELAEFINSHETPKHKELAQSMAETRLIALEVESALYNVVKLLEPSINRDDFANAEKTLQERLSKIRQSQKYAAITPDEVSFGKAELMSIFENLVKIQIENEIRQTRLDVELCSIDFLTGLPNKSSFDEELHKMHTQNGKEPTILAIDLGFVKYFNKEGNRQIGDAAILAAGFALYKTELEYPQIKVYRTGGDEFSVIIDGNEDEVVKIVNDILAQANTTGTIPSGKEVLGKYEPEAIQFNYGYCTKQKAEAALAILRDPTKKAFSESDLRKLDDTQKEHDPEFYAKTLGIVQNIVADLEIERQKITTRCAQLRQIIKSGNIEHFKIMYPYSGKALRGMSPDQFAQLVEQSYDLDENSFAEAIIATLDDQAGLSLERRNIIDRVVAGFVASAQNEQS